MGIGTFFLDAGNLHISVGILTSRSVLSSASPPPFLPGSPPTPFPSPLQSAAITQWCPHLQIFQMSASLLEKKSAPQGLPGRRGDLSPSSQGPLCLEAAGPPPPPTPGMHKLSRLYPRSSGDRYPPPPPPP
eukprot:Hpha_TRINITY_DN15390_c1_g1::TRINITY_DN15390_c1_g1_i1::g.92056::m.92056